MSKPLDFCENCRWVDYGMEAYEPMGIPEGVSRAEEGRSCPRCGEFKWYSVEMFDKAVDPEQFAAWLMNELKEEVRE